MPGRRPERCQRGAWGHRVARTQSITWLHALRMDEHSPDEPARAVYPGGILGLHQRAGARPAIMSEPTLIVPMVWPWVDRAAMSSRRPPPWRPTPLEHAPGQRPGGPAASWPRHCDSWHLYQSQSCSHSGTGQGRTTLGWWSTPAWAWGYWLLSVQVAAVLRQAS